MAEHFSAYRSSPQVHRESNPSTNFMPEAFRAWPALSVTIYMYVAPLTTSNLLFLLAINQRSTAVPRRAFPSLFLPNITEFSTSDQSIGGYTALVNVTRHPLAEMSSTSSGIPSNDEEAALKDVSLGLC